MDTTIWQWHGILLTDYIQALAAVVGVIAVVVGWFILRRERREEQGQIDNLGTIAEKQTEMIQHMAKQTEIVGKSFQLEKKNRKMNIRPQFVVFGHGGNSLSWSCDFRNVGKKAFDVEVKVINPVGVDVVSGIEKHDFKNTDSHLAISVVNNVTGAPTNITRSFECEVQYVDEDNNKYRQVGKSTSTNAGISVNINKPVEVDTNEE